MLSRLHVENYQSIAEADIELGEFTVITGPTSSGKTGLIKAARLAAFNARGTDYIRHGQKSCVVELGKDDGAVRIERGGRGKDSYRLHTGPAIRENPARTFTKLGSKVPEEVSSWLKLSELNFAGQFDSPYLLDASGGQVAKTLGELTRVTVVLDAASRAAGRKRSLNAALRAEQEQVTRLEAETAQYEGLEDEYTALESLQQALARAQAAAARHGRLSYLLGHFQSQVTLRDERMAAMAKAEPPDLAPLESASARLDRMRKLLLTLTGALEERAHFEQVRQAEARAEAQAETDLHATLVAAGTCPTCGQSTADVAIGV